MVPGIRQPYGRGFGEYEGIIIEPVQVSSKRRSTVGGVPGFCLQELTKFLKICFTNMTNCYPSLDS